jgi:hypothetical protein
MAPQLVQDTSPLVFPDGKLPFSEEPAAGPYPETNESSPQTCLAYVFQVASSFKFTD